MHNGTNSSKKLILSLHIPKTGGTSFAHYLKKQFGDKMMYCYPCAREWHPVYAWDWVELERKKDFLPCADHRSSFEEINRLVQERGIKCIHGHWSSRYARSHFPEATYVTWVRDPLERVYSHWDHSRRYPKECDAGIRNLVEGGRFREFVRSTANLQTASLEPLAIGDFGFVGITENFDKSLRRFEDVFGLPRQDMPRCNVNPAKREALYDIPAQIARRIRKHNRLDEKLYQAALSLRHDYRIRPALAVRLRRGLSRWAPAPVRGVWALSKRVGRSIKERIARS